MSRTLIDPVVKVSSVETCYTVNPDSRSGVQAMTKDISDLAVLFYKLCVNEKIESSTESPPPMPDELYSPVALLIRSAWNGIGIRRASDLFEKVFAIDENINGAPPDE